MVGRGLVGSEVVLAKGKFRGVIPIKCPPEGSDTTRKTDPS